PGTRGRPLQLLLPSLPFGLALRLSRPENCWQPLAAVLRQTTVALARYRFFFPISSFPRRLFRLGLAWPTPVPARATVPRFRLGAVTVMPFFPSTRSPCPAALEVTAASTGRHCDYP